MNHNPRYNDLRELSWRRKLTDAEERELRALLATDTAARSDWEAEAELNDVLLRLPDAPVASNFTARVLRAVERETDTTRTRGWSLWRYLPRWVPKAALAGCALLLGVFGYQRHQKMETARSVARISEVASLPEPELLRDFDAIRQLGQTPAPDEELLALLK